MEFCQLKSVKYINHQAKLVDGASEVHQMIINRFFNNHKSDFWQWGIGEDI